jgi:hypothetical protein
VLPVAGVPSPAQANVLRPNNKMPVATATKPFCSMQKRSTRPNPPTIRKMKRGRQQLRQRTSEDELVRVNQLKLSNTLNLAENTFSRARSNRSS